MFTSVDLDDLAIYFNALGNRTRMIMYTRVFSVRRCKTVELTCGLRVSKATAYEHLRILERAGMINRVRREHRVYCQINYKAYEQIRTYFEEARKQKRWQEKLMGFEYIGDWNEYEEEQYHIERDWADREYGEHP